MPPSILCQNLLVILTPVDRTRREVVVVDDAVGDAVAYMAGLPLDANVLTMTVMASKMPFRNQ